MVEVRKASEGDTLLEMVDSLDYTDGVTDEVFAALEEANAYATKTGIDDAVRIILQNLFKGGFVRENEFGILFIEHNGVKRYFLGHSGLNSGTTGQAVLDIVSRK